MEAIAATEGTGMQALSLAQQEALWQAVKQAEKGTA